MEKFRFHGDIHGKTQKFLANCSTERTNIQLGDFGFGFVPIPKLPENTWFIRGNHDKPEQALNHKKCVKDGSVLRLESGSKVMFIGGALSIDKQYRVAGRDWWPGEELSYRQLEALITLYFKEKPDVMITHDCPQSASKEMFNFSEKRHHPSRTGQAFQQM